MKINNKYFSHLKIKLPLLLGIFIICIALGSKINLVPNAISIEILSPEDDDVYQLFYDTGNGGFNETNSIKVNIAQSKASKEIIFFELPNSLIKGIRIDLGTKINKNINIKSIKFKHNFCRLNFSLNLYKLSSNEIFKNFKKLNNISVIRVKENQLHITSSGNAPYMVFTGDLNKVYSYICKKILILKIFYYILSLILSIILSYVLDWVILIDLILKISKQSTLLENGLYIVAIYIFSTTMNINNFFRIT